VPDFREQLSSAIVELPVSSLRRMVGVVRLLDRLSRNPAYREQVYAEAPDVARFDPGHDAVMMCYDFHLDGEMPRLIEVNTNAGGGMLAYLAHAPALPVDHRSLSAKFRERLLQTFSEEIQKHSAGALLKPKRIAIIDENPTEQHLYPEMVAFANLFRDWGVPTEIVEPQRLQASADGVGLDGQPVDLVYNRHCDFYLASDEMAGLRQAYLAGKVCLTPNPHMYGLLADKRRMILWIDTACHAAWHLSGKESRLLGQVVPRTSLLTEMDLQQVWSDRKQLIFKPADSFGSKGVLVGEKISRKRFDQLALATTLVQERVPPSMTEVVGHDPMKTDLRLYAYRNRVLGLTARLYHGQVTNLRTPGGGFARVELT
jgi:hypothetical protein